jgi:hypothetical protein
LALVGSLYCIQMTRMTSLSSQTLTFTVELRAAYRAFLNGGVRVGRRQMVWLRQAISLLIIFFPFLALNSTSILSKIKCVFLVCFLSILIIFLLLFFVYILLKLILFFNFISQHLISFNFCVQFGVHYFDCYFLIFFLIYFIFQFHISLFYSFNFYIKLGSHYFDWLFIDFFKFYLSLFYSFNFYIKLGFYSFDCYLFCFLILLFIDFFFNFISRYLDDWEFYFLIFSCLSFMG